MKVEYKQKAHESTSNARGRYFHRKYKQDTSGFWLSKEQLLQIANRLDESQGIGVMVGAHPATNHSHEDWFSVEIFVLRSDDNFAMNGLYLTEKTKIADESVKDSVFSGIRVTHNDLTNNEGQMFPPPMP